MGRFTKFVGKLFGKKTQNNEHPSVNQCRALVLFKPNCINVNILNAIGAVINLNVQSNTTANFLKKQSIEVFLTKNGLQFYSTNIKKLCRKYKLISVRMERDLNEQITLEELGIINDDEIILSVKLKSKKNSQLQNFQKITQIVINKATADLPKALRNPPFINFEEIRSINIQIYIRKLILCSAKLSAYIIGSQPNAERLVAMLKEKFIFRQKFEHTSIVQQLNDMGFIHGNIIYALSLKNNNYVEALEWLMANNSKMNVLASASNEFSISNRMDSVDSLHNQITNNIQTLLEIIGIVSKLNEAPVANDVIRIIEMGFDSQSVMQALKICDNDPVIACEWLCGDRERLINEVEYGFAFDSPIVQSLLLDAQFQCNLSNPQIFIAYLSVLAQYPDVGYIFHDNKIVSKSVVLMLNKFYQEKQIHPMHQYRLTD